MEAGSHYKGVQDFAGNPAYTERKQSGDPARLLGLKVEVVFEDGEVLVGYTMSYDPRRPGFFPFPADPRSNNLRVFAISNAVRQTAGGQGMVDPKLVGDIQAVVNVLRQTVSEWDALVRSVEELTHDHAQLRARLEQLEREHRELQGVHARLRQEHDAAVRSATQLRSAHETLSVQYEGCTRALRDLREQHEAALRDRESAANELATILRRLQG